MMFDTLTKAERRVLALLADGHANKEIGYQLGMGEGTVKNHVMHILKKMNRTNRVQIAVDYVREQFAAAEREAA